MGKNKPSPALNSRQLSADAMKATEAVGVYLALAACSLILINRIKRKRANTKKRRRPRCWVRRWLIERNNNEVNTMYKLQRELLALGDVDEFKLAMRMPPDVFHDLLDRVRERITKKNSNFRKSISAEERLTMTLRYLAFGDTFRSLHQQFRVGHCMVGRIIKDTCEAIFLSLEEEFLKVPDQKDEWLNIAKQYEKKWNLPNVLGSLDGKHVRIAKPPNSGSLFFNYKGYTSLILLAAVDASYRLLYFDIGSEGKASDGGIWKKSTLYKLINDKKNPLNLPRGRKLPGFEGILPYFFISDDAFSMSFNLLKPYGHLDMNYAHRIFNYRISRARRCVENFFGILATRFRILRREMEMRPEGCEAAILAIVALHNYLLDKCRPVYLGRPEVEGSDYELHDDQQLDKTLSDLQHPTAYAKDVRERLSRYFFTKEGQVPWQFRSVPRPFGHSDQD